MREFKWVLHMIEDEHKRLKWLADAIVGMCSEDKISDVRLLYQMFKYNDVFNREGGIEKMATGEIQPSGFVFFIIE